MCQDIGPSPNDNYEEHKNHGKENREEHSHEAQINSDTDVRQDDIPVNTTIENDTKQEVHNKSDDATTNASKGKADDNADTKTENKTTDSSGSTTEEKQSKASEEREKERPIIIEKTVSMFSSLMSSISSGFKGVPEKFESFKDGMKESFKEKTEKAYKDFQNSAKGQEIKEFLKELNSGYRDLMNKPADNSTSIANKDKNSKHEPKKDTKPIIPSRTMKPEQIAATRFVMSMKDPTFNFTPIQTETKVQDEDKSSSSSTEITGDKSGEKSSGIVIPTSVGDTETSEKPTYDPQQNVTAILTANAKEEQKRSDEKYTSLSSNFFQDGKEYTPATARIEVVEKIDSLGKADKNNNSITAYTMIKYVSGKPEIYKTALERIVQLNPNMDISSLRGVTMGEVKYGTIYGSEQKPILAKDLDSRPESTYKLTAMIATCAVAVLTCSKDMQEFKDIQAEKAAIGLPADSQIMTPKEIEIYKNFGIISDEKATELRQEYQSRVNEIDGKISSEIDKIGHIDIPIESARLFNDICSLGTGDDKTSILEISKEELTSTQNLKEEFAAGNITITEYATQLEHIATYSEIAAAVQDIKADMAEYTSTIEAGIQSGILEQTEAGYRVTTDLVYQPDETSAISCPEGTIFPFETNAMSRIEEIKEIFENYSSGNVSAEDTLSAIGSMSEASFEQEQFSQSEFYAFINSNIQES